MAYRFAHWWLLALIPLIVIAFWPGYFHAPRSAPFALHAHGLSAMAWLLLLAMQSWSAQTRRWAWHRASGLALFVAVPLFVAGGLLAIRQMGWLAQAGDDPFRAAFGARLAPVDLLSVLVLPWLVSEALRERRRIRRHAAAMLSTALLVLPPTLGRLAPLLPGFPWGVPIGGFELSFHLGGAAAMLIAAALWRAGRDADTRPFAVTACVLAFGSILFETVGRSAGWRRLFFAAITVSPVPLAAAGAFATLLLLVAAWIGGRPVPRAATAAA